MGFIINKKVKQTPHVNSLHQGGSYILPGCGEGGTLIQKEFFKVILDNLELMVKKKVIKV